MFYIKYARNSSSVPTELAATTSFPTQEAAQAEIDRRTAINGSWRSSYINGYVFVVVPVPWQEREKTKLANGAHKPPVWYRERKIVDYASSFRDHYPHVSTEDPTMLAYTPSPEYGERDRQNRIKPGKYLQKYYGKSEKTGRIGFGPLKGYEPILTPQEIAYYAEWWETGSKPSRFKDWELRFAETPEDIAKIYRDGPRSCMSSGQVPHGSDLKKSPVRVYGAGDLQLAYLWDPATKKPRARALTWPAKEVFGRCYPATQNWSTDGFTSSQDATDCENELRARLRAKGWTDIKSKSNVFDGARLLMEPITDKKGYYRMPYLDNTYMVSLSKDEQHFIMKLKGLYHCQHTNGELFVTKKFTCDRCEGSYDENNGYGESQFSKVFTVVPTVPTDEPTGEKKWCASCARHSYVCRGLNQRLSVQDFPQVRVNGYHYSELWANRQTDLYTCELTGHRYSTERYPSVKTPTGLACKANVGEYGFICGYDGVVYKMDQASRIWCGFPKSMDTDKTITPEDRAKHDLRTRVQTWSDRNAGWTIEGVDHTSYLYQFQDIHKDYLRRKEYAAERKAELARLDAEAASRSVDVYIATSVAAAVEVATPVRVPRRRPTAARIAAE